MKFVFLVEGESPKSGKPGPLGPQWEQWRFEGPEQPFVEATFSGFPLDQLLISLLGSQAWRLRLPLLPQAGQPPAERTPAVDGAVCPSVFFHSGLSVTGL